MDNNVEVRISRIESKVSFYRAATLFMVVLSVVGWALIAWSFFGTKEVLRAKALVIEDNAGRPRVAIGAPIPFTAGRSRKDELTGIVYMDESGADRITFGKAPDPMTPEGIKPRRVAGSGILIHDRDGVERGGYSVLDDDTALLTLDWPKTGEAAVMSSANGFSGIGLFHKSPIGVYREAITFGVESDGNKYFAKLTNAQGNEAVSLRAEGTQTPVLKGKFEVRREDASQP